MPVPPSELASTAQAGGRPDGAPVRLAADSGWNLVVDQGALVAHAGADHRFEVEDCPPTAAEELQAQFRTGRVDIPAAGSESAVAVEQLLLLGALRPELASPASRLAVFVRTVGPDRSGLAEALAQASNPETVTFTSGPDQAHLSLIIRTGGTLAEAAEAAPDQSPHLFADAAYHHTLSLGPLVIPGQTACLSCLAGRIGHRWGDDPSPAQPAMVLRTGLLAGWMGAELDNVARGRSTLTNRTVSLDVAAHRIDEHSLLKLPWCPRCADTRSDGRIDLPWVAAGTEP